MTRLRDVEFARAPRRLARTGLLAWVRGRLGKVEIDGIAVRRSRTGRRRVTWPARRDRVGRQHRYVWLADAVARREIERQILAAFDALEGRP